MKPLLSPPFTAVGSAVYSLDGEICRVGSQLSLTVQGRRDVAKKIAELLAREYSLPAGPEPVPAATKTAGRLEGSGY